MNNYTVYMHISPSGKRYIGITSLKPERRWNNGKGYKEQYFTNAINKYGWDNFEHIIIAKGLSEEEAKWLEIELIAKFDSTNRDKGYNITKGGDTVSEETKKKMSEAKIGENHPMYGKKRPEISERMSGESNPMYGKGYLISGENHANVKGGSNPRAKSVIAIINDKIFGAFDYIKQGAEYFGCHRGDISKCCKGKRKSAGKYNGYKIVWRYITIIEL